MYTFFLVGYQVFYLLSSDKNSLLVTYQKKEELAVFVYAKKVGLLVACNTYEENESYEIDSRWTEKWNGSNERVARVRRWQSSDKSHPPVIVFPRSNRIVAGWRSLNKKQSWEGGDRETVKKGTNNGNGVSLRGNRRRVLAE